MLLRKVFIPTHRESLFEAKLAKFAIERKLPPGSPIKVEIVETNDPALDRFAAPEKMAFVGRALSITPWVLAIQDITPLMDMDLGEKRVAVAKGRSGWDSTVMLMEAERLKDWRMKDFKMALETKQVEREQIISLEIEPDIMELSRVWNNVDRLSLETKMLNLDNSLTRPWKTGLPVEHTRATPSWLDRIKTMFKKETQLHRRHPDRGVMAFFIDLVRQAYKAKVFDDAFIAREIKEKRISPDIATIVRG